MRPAPRLGQRAIDDPQHIFPGHIGPQATHMGHPVLRRLVQALHEAVLPRQSNLAKGGRVFGTQARVPANAPFGARAGKASFGALPDQGALELGGSTKHLKRKFALRRCRVDRILKRTEEGTLRLEPFDHFQQMRERAGQPVDPHDDQRVTLGHALQHAGEDRPCAVAARGLFLMNLGTACGFQGLRLGQGGRLIASHFASPFFRCGAESR